MLEPEFKLRGGRGGAMMLGKLPVPGHPTNLDNSRAVDASGGCLDIFYHPFLFSSFSLSLWKKAQF